MNCKRCASDQPKEFTRELATQVTEIISLLKFCDPFVAWFKITVFLFIGGINLGLTFHRNLAGSWIGGSSAEELWTDCSQTAKNSSAFDMCVLKAVKMCRICGDGNQSEFNSEICIHFPGLKGLNTPSVFVFPKLAVLFRVWLRGIFHSQKRVATT
jgi:hypothetical protein